MKVEVDEELCIGTMSCEQTCPDVFKVEAGISKVLVDEVPEDMEDLVREAAENCPVQAIKIIED